MDPYATHQRLLIAAAMQTDGPIVEMGCGDYSTPLLAEIAAHQGRTFEVYTTNRKWGSRYELMCRVNYIDDWSEYPYPKCGLTFLDNEQYVRDRQLHIPKLLETSGVVMCHDFGYNKWGAKYFTVLNGDPKSVVMSNVIDIKLHDSIESVSSEISLKECNTREQLAGKFHGVGIELGVASGDYSACILDNNKVDTLYSIDKWSDHHDIREYIDVLKRFSVHGNRSVVMRATFEESLGHFDDETIDFIYIDGYAHTGQEGGKTLEQWWPKIKKGGIFAGHDYHEDWPLTMKAVDEFASRHGLIICATENDQHPSWSVRKPEEKPKNKTIPIVACVYKMGGDFTAEYVWRLHKNILEHSGRKIDFVVYTDSEEKMPGRVTKLQDNLPGWWSKLELFREFLGRVVYFDLDTIITGSIDPLLEYDGPIALLDDLWAPNNKLSTGVMVWNSPMQFLVPGEEEKAKIISNPNAKDEFYVVGKLKQMKWHVDIVQDIVKVASYKWECQEKGVPEGTNVVCFHGRPRPHEIGWKLC